MVSRRIGCLERTYCFTGMMTERCRFLSGWTDCPQKLRELGHELRRPEADFLRDGIYELRVRLQRVNYRMLYFFHRDTAVVLSYGLLKERRVPPKEIDRAVKHRAKFEENPEQHTHEEA
jgi:hypothetical protein